LLSEQVSPERLLPAAEARLASLIAYPGTPFRLTKRLANRALVQRLHAVREEAAEAHVAAFLERTGAAHFSRILGR
jgi:hypothetical protein